MTSAISHKMHGALEFVRAGVKPRDAAQAAGVTLQALYRAMRREKLGQRCPQCGHILTARHIQPPEPPDYEARVTALEDKGCTRSDAQGIVDAELMQRS